MKIVTKLEINELCFFIMGDRVNEARVKGIDIAVTSSDVNITYTIDRNPLGGSYTNRIAEEDIFGTKQELLNSL